MILPCYAPDLETKKKKTLINNIGLVELCVATKPSNSVVAYLKESKKPIFSQSVYDILRRGPSARTVFYLRPLGQRRCCASELFSRKARNGQRLREYFAESLSPGTVLRVTLSSLIPVYIEHAVYEALLKVGKHGGHVSVLTRRWGPLRVLRVKHTTIRF